MSKYGLQLRGKKPEQKQAARPPLPKVLGFGDDDDDDDNVERDILRQAYKNKTHKDVEELHKKTLEEDPSAFDYDGVYDKMKEKQILPKEQERKDRKPKYIPALINKAKVREREHEITYERKLAKERSVDEHLYADKDKFVTSAYKKKLAEQAKWIEEERIRELREQKDDVTKKTDISDFYFNLAKNVAFGAGDADEGKSKRQPDEVLRQVSPSRTGTGSDSPRMAKRPPDEISENHSPKQKPDRSYREPVSNSPVQDRVTDEQTVRNLQKPDSRERSEEPRNLQKPDSQERSEEPKPDNQKASEDAMAAEKDHHKRNEDAIAAAKERFLARKRAKKAQ